MHKTEISASLLTRGSTSITVALHTMTTILVTVGSTRFEALSDTALSPSFMDTLPSLGVSELVVQLGSARVPDHILRGGEYTHQVGDKALRVRVLEYTNGLAEMEKLVKSADVVISHSGKSIQGPC